MDEFKDTISHNLPFISVIAYGKHEYVGLVINQDQHVTSFYDLNAIATNEERLQFLAVGETWWWETNRKFPIIAFCKTQVEPFNYAIKTFISKDVKIILGPTVSLTKVNEKRIKRKSVHLVRRR